MISEFPRRDYRSQGKVCESHSVIIGGFDKILCESPSAEASSSLPKLFDVVIAVACRPRGTVRLRRSLDEVNFQSSDEVCGC
jgi:hypothetical protein